jgi:hypothetical protein
MTFPAERLTLVPGAPIPNSVRSSRSNWASVLGAGKRAADLPLLLSQIYSLCGYAHRQCASAAVRAAKGEAQAGINKVTMAERSQMQWGSVREHVRRMWLDWPVQLANLSGHTFSIASGEAALKSCPAWRADTLSAAMLDWLQTHVIGEDSGDDPQDWLMRWEGEPAQTLARWSQQGETPLASLMRAIIERDAMEETPDQDVVLMDGTNVMPDVLADLLVGLRTEPRFCLRPLMRSNCANTGVWTRVNDAHRLALRTPAMRMGARVAELLRLCLPDEPLRSGANWLNAGSLAVGEGEGLAWTEMARGVLIHRVQLEPDMLTVKACQVIAPTEWNFHPQGALARTMSAMSPQFESQDPLSQIPLDIAVLMASYDPCVPFQVDREAVHA